VGAFPERAQADVRRWFTKRVLLSMESPPVAAELYGNPHEVSTPIGSVATKNMTTTVLLVRHGHTAAIGSRLVGRLPGIPLTRTGHDQALRLLTRLSSHAPAAIYSSPLERAIQTARPFAQARGLPVTECPGLTDIDFGEWTGQTFAALDQLPAWHDFNTARGTAPVPGGESAADVQRRAVQSVEAIASSHPGATIVAFTHSDIIRSVLLHYAAKPLDRIEDFEIGPASITALSLAPPAARILYMNDPDPG
jgi:broad specificity phosphatase PhoE